MNKILSIMLTLALCLTLFPATAKAATTKYIIDADVEYTIAPGEKITLYVKTKKTITWSSSRKAVATVSKKGVVTGKADGTTAITAKIGNKKYKCTVVVNNYEEDLQYLRDITENDYVNKFSADTLAPDTEYALEDDTEKTNDKKASDETIKAMSRYGFGNSEDLETSIGKAYIEFCNSWVSEYELKNTYNISVAWNWPKNQIYLMLDFENKLVIESTPDKFASGEIYSGSGIQYQYLEKFEYKGESYIEKQFYFNREDLKTASIIK